MLLGIVYLATSIYVASEITKSAHQPLNRAATEVSPNYEALSFFSRVDHLRLRGWLFHISPPPAAGLSWPPPGDRRSAILVHGHDANRVNPDWDELGIARALLGHGLDVLVFDLRAAGESEGHRETFGTLEPRDLLGAYDFMTSRGYRPPSMLIMGASMGGATVIESAAQLRAVAALVSDSAYSDVRGLIVPRLHARLPAVFDVGIESAASLLFGLNMDLRPADAVRALPDRAFLFIDCDRDDYVAPENSQRLWQASGNPESHLLAIHCTKHLSTFKTDPNTYLAGLFAFIDRQFAEHGG